MLLHIFRLEAKRSKAAGGNSMEVQEPRGTRRVRGYKWKGPLRACEEGEGGRFMPQDGTLAPESDRQLRKVYPRMRVEDQEWC